MGVDPKDAEKRSTEVVVERNNMNYKQVQRYIRLTELVPDLQKMVDEKGLSFTPVVEFRSSNPNIRGISPFPLKGSSPISLALTGAKAPGTG